MRQINNVEAKLRINYNRRKYYIKNKPNILSFTVQAPVYEEYQKIDLQKNSRYPRINHKTTLSNCRGTKIEVGSSADATKERKWQNALDQYIAIKEKFINEKHIFDTKFKFLQLNKINQARKKKLISQFSLDTKSISNDNKSQMEEQYENINQISQISQSCKFKVQLKQKYNANQTSIFNNLSSGEIKSNRIKQMSKDGIASQQRQQKILNNFISKYFKGKFKYSNPQKRIKTDVSKNYLHISQYMKTCHN